MGPGCETQPGYRGLMDSGRHARFELPSTRRTP
jgi:hypothetical protein